MIHRRRRTPRPAHYPSLGTTAVGERAEVEPVATFARPSSCQSDLDAAVGGCTAERLPVEDDPERRMGYGWHRFLDDLVCCRVADGTVWSWRRWIDSADGRQEDQA